MKYPLYDGYGFERYVHGSPGWGPMVRKQYVFEATPLKALGRSQLSPYWRFEIWSKEEDRWVPLEGPDEPEATGELKEVRDDPHLRRILQLERFRRF